MSEMRFKLHEVVVVLVKVSATKLVAVHPAL